MSTGAGNRIRTGDLLITSQLLYQLSYAGIWARQGPEVTGDSLPPQPDFSLRVGNRRLRVNPRRPRSFSRLRPPLCADFGIRSLVQALLISRLQDEPTRLNI